MGIFARSKKDESPVAATPAPTPKLAPKPQSKQSPADRARQDLKLKIHRDLLQRIDLTNLLTMDADQANSEVKQVILQLIGEQTTPMSTRDRQQLAEEIHAEVYGLGPLEPLMRDPDVSDILVNGSRQVYVERFGKLELTPVIFRDDEHLLQIIDRIVSTVGRRIDESSPMVDARLADGSRVNAIIPPLALDGPSVSIRRFGAKPLSVESLLANNSLSPDMVKVLEAMVLARLNILVIGGTGSGKTTLLNCLSSFIPEDERIVTVEDSAELQLQQQHVVRLESRPANIEGKGSVDARDLVRNCLRMRPDRIVVGEVRGAEALDMLQAMNTGHDGSISTVHANNAREAIGRLEMMLQMAGLNLPIRPMRQQIASAVDVIVVAGRLSDGSRKVLGISEIVGMEGDSVMLQDLFAFEREGLDENGRITGRFASTGIRPHFISKLKSSSNAIDLDAFDYLNE